MQVSVEERIADIKAGWRCICPRCKRWIARGERIKQHGTRNGKPRWGHVECKPEATGQEAAAVLIEAVAELQARLAEVEANSTPRVIEIKHAEGEAVKIEGAVHPIFDSVLQFAQARKHIFLPGPAGCGKSHLAKQIADALKLRFGFISCSAGMSESQLLGRLVPAGEGGKFEFVTTQFLDCYEKGGVFLFDEIDAADANVLLVINSALANGHLSVPSRHENPVAMRHPDFVCIAAANTFGRGADRQYVGRSELDESTLDRFRIGTVPMDYDERLERQLCPNPAALRQVGRLSGQGPREPLGAGGLDAVYERRLRDGCQVGLDDRDGRSQVVCRLACGRSCQGERVIRCVTLARTRRTGRPTAGYSTASVT